MTSFEALGYIATFFTTGAYVPQAYKIIKTKSTQSLSVPTYVMIVMGSMLWVYYAYTRQDFPVVIANGVTGLLSLIILIIKFGSNDKLPAEEAAPDELPKSPLT
ncbi:SemiSWEET transporter [Pedobacter sp. MC2016-15]|jgi:MtN3 and saliva related transmembrane protein|uniref:SemiSWEET family sugar transporter n=1 Tax=Pedobacter sp. MC2016-15 TaxID=2994473 RepID=UPI00224678C4|nr:SemiSWEET transporter [Pedobacter sp. MC2016-15]MCX2480198.1 SemiSWEET transporter [Pedobacter sp. MC2016-15]